MKVFGDEGGAYDSDYTAAIEDAIVLGADTINLSLGSASPGPSKARTEAYQKIFDDLENASSVVTVSSGNAGYWAKNADPIGYLYSDGVSMQTDGQPGSYANSLTVASVDNDGFIGNYLLIGQDPIAPSETTGFTNKPGTTCCLPMQMQSRTRLSSFPEGSPRSTRSMTPQPPQARWRAWSTTTSPAQSTWT